MRRGADACGQSRPMTALSSGRLRLSSPSCSPSMSLPDRRCRGRLRRRAAWAAAALLIVWVGANGALSAPGGRWWPLSQTPCWQDADVPGPGCAAEPDPLYALLPASPLPGDALASFVAPSPSAVPETQPALQPPAGALLQARLDMEGARGHVDAVLRPGPDGTRLAARGMGLQLHPAQRTDELLLGRFVSGGAGLRPDLPIVGLRYDSRRTVPGAAASVAGGLTPVRLLTLPAGLHDWSLGRLEVDVRELRGGAGAPAGPGLLPRGASDFSLEIGALARDAERFERTGLPAATLTWRHGWIGGQTLSVHAVQAGDSRLLAGLSQFRWMGRATAGATVRERGLGAEPGWLLAHEYQGEGLSSRLRLEGVGGEPRVASGSPLDPPHRRQAEFSLSWALGAGRALTLAAGERVGVGGERSGTLSLGSSLRSRDGGQFSWGLKRSHDAEGTLGFSLDWRIPLARPRFLRGPGPALPRRVGVLR